MDRKEVNHHGPRNGEAGLSLDYLRRRSLHRVWWDSARVAMRRGPVPRLGEPHSSPDSRPFVSGKRV